MLTYTRGISVYYFPDTPDLYHGSLESVGSWNLKKSGFVLFLV